MLTKKELDLFEKNCVNIGYSMCQAEAITVMRDLLNECTTHEQLEILKIGKDKILSLKCVWKETAS